MPQRHDKKDPQHTRKESKDKQRLLRKSNRRKSSMFKIGFRQYNSDGCIEQVSDDLSKNNARQHHLHKISHEDSSILPSEWYTIIQNDDTKNYDRIMQIFPDRKLNLIQGKFTYQADMHLSKIAQELKARCTFETAFILACAYASKEIVEKMLIDGADVRVRERSGLNFVHALIETVAENRAIERELISVYALVMDRTTATIKRELLTVEDRQGYRPLELAVLRGAYGFLKVIFDTPGVYRDINPAGQLGVHTFVRYDVTEYENHENRDRELRSPLRIMTFMAESHVRSYLKFDIHSMPAIQRWRKDKIKNSTPIIAVWYLFKTIFISAVIFLDASRLSSLKEVKGNKTAHALSVGDELIDDGIIIVMAVMGGSILLVSIVFNIQHLMDKKRRAVDKHAYHHQYLVHSVSFTYVQIIMCALVVAQFIMANAGVSKFALYSVKSVLIPFGLMSYLQIFLIIPYIDRFVIALHRMVLVLLKFVVIHMTVRLVFCLFLMNIEYGHPSTNFGDLSEAFYGIFLLDLNDIQLAPPFYLQFTHLSFFYISGVLLINYLIAVMTDMAAEVNQYGIIFCDLTKLELAYQAEENFGRYIQKFSNKINYYHLIAKTMESKTVKQFEMSSENKIDDDKYDI